MGLDMYFYKVKDGVREEFGYYRKHYDLHDWMEKRWNNKGLNLSRDDDGINKSNVDFLCIPFELTENDLVDLRKWVMGLNYQVWLSGFANVKEYRQRDLNLIKKARQAIKDGYTVLYFSL